MRATLALLPSLLLLTSALAEGDKPGWVERHPADGALAELLSKEAKVAAAAKRQPVAYLHATWCKPCLALQRSLKDPRMVDAFAGAHVVKLDIDEWPAAELEKAGLRARAVPTFFTLDGRGRPTGRTISGDAWGEDTPANMAGPLKRFFAGQQPR